MIKKLRFLTISLLSSFVAYGNSFSLELPRDYATYDANGMIPFEDVQKPSAKVAQAMDYEKRGELSKAFDLYWKAFLANKQDLQPVIGVASCAQKLGKRYIEWVEKRFAADPALYPTCVPSHDWPMLVMRGVMYDTMAEPDKGKCWGSFFKCGDYGVQKFISTLRLFRYERLTPTEYRRFFDKLGQQYPNAKGFQYYRALSYFNGNLGEYFIDPKTGKSKRAGIESDRPQAQTALKILQPYLEETPAPVWANYLAARMYQNLKRKDLALSYAQKVFSYTSKSQKVKAMSGRLRETIK